MAGRILLVDDDAAVRDVLALLLEAEGFVVEKAASAEQALELWRSFVPHLIVTDNGMPGMSGLAGVALIRSQKQVPTVLFSGTVNEAVLSAAHRDGIQVVQKPHIGRLLEVIRDLTSN